MKAISFLVVLLAISSCGGGSSGSDITIDSDIDNSSGQSCSTYQSNNGSGSTLNCTIVHDNITRQFFVYVGSGYQSNSPVLFVLHGYTSRGLWIMNYSGFQSIAYDTGFVKKLNQPQSIASVNLGIDNFSSYELKTFSFFAPTNSFPP